MFLLDSKPARRKITLFDTISLIVSFFSGSSGSFGETRIFICLFSSNLFLAKGISPIDNAHFHEKFDNSTFERSSIDPSGLCGFRFLRSTNRRFCTNEGRIDSEFFVIAQHFYERTKISFSMSIFGRPDAETEVWRRFISSHHDEVKDPRSLSLRETQS